MVRTFEDGICLEETEGCDCDCGPPPPKFFPLSQYRVTDPCKKCLIKVMCSQACDNAIKYQAFHGMMFSYKHRILKRLHDPLVLGGILITSVFTIAITLSLLQ